MLLRILLACALASLALPQSRTLFRSPTLSKTHIVFSYADDLWIVARTGGEASRLTTGIGVETAASFSPDGTQVAFTGEYDGNADVFVVAATGGVPKRVTHHPSAELVEGWTPDGKQILFSSTGMNSNSRPRLYTVPPTGGFPTELPLPIAADGTFSPDGKRIAYLPVERANLAWKRYRGGRASAVWIANLADSSIVKVPRTDSNDWGPMWDGDKVYFVSDRNGPDTIYAYDTKTKAVAPLFENKGLDVKAAQLGPGAIVYEQFGSIHLYDFKSKKSTPVAITLNGDLPEVRPRFERVGRQLRNGAISPTGARALFEARGDIVTVPAEKGDPRNLTNSTGVADRDPAWSPDGKWIAYFSDESGEYQLHLRDQTGRGEVKKLPLAKKPTFYYGPTWSPDSKKIAYRDKKEQLWYLDLDKPEPVLVDTATYQGAHTQMKPMWSPDSKWLAYGRDLKTHLFAVFVYSLESAKSTQLTDGMSDAREAVWDRSGKYLFFMASTNSGPTLGGLDLSSSNRPVTSSLYAVVLDKNDPSPLAPESDEEKVAATDDKEKEKKDDAGAKKKGVAVKIDFDGISQRIIPLPVPARNYGGLLTGKNGILFYGEEPIVPGMGSGGGPGPQGVTLHRFDLAKRKSEVFMSGASFYDISANGEKMLLRSGDGRWLIAGTAAPPKPGEGSLRTDGLETWVDPRAEWKQMFKEVWRIERDFFYDPSYHGLDLQAAEERYALYLSAVGSRNDLNYLFREMLGELTIGHLYVSGGDTPEPNRVRGGLLGADYKIENGLYRFARVYSGESWNPQTRAPLTQPGVNVVAGDYLLAINGKPLTANDDVFGALEGKAGKTVLLRVGPNANGDGARDVTVVPTDDEMSLRTLAWIEENRQRVDKLSNGKLAYIHLPDTGGGGYAYFNRYYFAQTDKQGAVIDERFNRGGKAADYVIDYLRRPLWNWWSSRDGQIYSTPATAIFGPMVMVANEYSGSGGDLLPWLFQRAKLGPVVGKRTWGGLVGIGGYPTLVDGGSVTAPHFAFFNPEGKWDVENYGTAPDVEVEFDPQQWRQGRDPQLEKAVELALAALKKSPPPVPKRPAYPDYHKKKTGASDQ